MPSTTRPPILTGFLRIPIANCHRIATGDQGSLFGFCTDEVSCYLRNSVGSLAILRAIRRASFRAANCIVTNGRVTHSFTAAGGKKTDKKLACSWVKAPPPWTPVSFEPGCTRATTVQMKKGAGRSRRPRIIQTDSKVFTSSSLNRRWSQHPNCRQLSRSQPDSLRW